MSGHRHLARVRAQTIQELLLESCPTFRRRRPGAAAPAATICLPPRRPQTAAGGQHTQIGSGPPGAPLALEAAKCGGRRVTTVLIADLAPAQWTRFSFYRGLLSHFLVSYRPLAIFEAAAANRAATTRWEKSNGRTSCVLGPANTRGSQSDIAAALREDTAPNRSPLPQPEG